MTENKSIQSGRIIVINAILILSVIALLIAQNIYFLDKTSSTLLTIDTHHNRKIDVIMSMTNVVRERSLLMVTMHFSNDAWKKDELFIKFHKLRPVFIELKNEFEILGLLENEATLFKKAMAIINKTERLQNDIAERLQSGDDKNIHSDISEKDMPLESILLDIFESLIKITRDNADIAKKQAQEEYQQTLKLILLAAALVFIFIIIMVRKSLYQIRRIESDLISEAKSLSWDATHDDLTNAHNRRWIKYKVDLLKNNKEKKVNKHSILYIDLDEFKPVNDNFGHLTGDKFLCGVTREFEHCIRQNDSLARMGGDEFAILLENCDVKKASEIANCIIKRIDKYTLIDNGEVVTIAGCSIGICEFQNLTISYEKLITQADSACYSAKNNGKNQIYIFSG